MAYSQDTIIALITGALLGLGFAMVFINRKNFRLKSPAPAQPVLVRDEDEFTDGEDDYDSDNDDGQEQYKMVLIVNQSLQMTKGKVVAQCCHGCLGAYKKASKEALQIWGSQGQAKITLKGPDEDALRHVAQQARKTNLPYYLVADAGRTQIAAGSITVCAVGPAPASQIDKFSGQLKLL
ncbi:peptidyl-tRNA hydrolase [Batrachochytrium salamandrivorans]|nr:peptidyl-tRNA hydrolase [Batrachochytrium salamandrivorans]